MIMIHIESWFLDKLRNIWTTRVFDFWLAEIYASFFSERVKKLLGFSLHGYDDPLQGLSFREGIPLPHGSLAPGLASPEERGERCRNFGRVHAIRQFRYLFPIFLQSLFPLLLPRGVWELTDHLVFR